MLRKYLYINIMNKLNTFIFLSSIFVITSCGGGGGGSGSDSNSVNTAPQLTGTIDFAIDENTTNVATFEATDAQNDTITYFIEGTDSTLLTINETSGVLAFKSAPDYENPEDANTDNIYELSVGASDGSLSSTLGIVVTVNDVNETASATISVNNQSIKTYSQITLNWECTASSNAEAEGDWTGSKSLSGSESIYLSTSGTKTYTIKCINDSGQESASVDVNVGDITLKNVPSSISLFKDD